MIGIYVVCLSAYNNGQLHGDWIDLEKCEFDSDTVWDKIHEILETSPEEDAEEWSIHDYDEMVDMGENPDIEELCDVAELVAEYGKKLVSELLERYSDSNSVREALECNNAGTYDSVDEFAYEYLSELVNIPDALVGYIDYERFGNDMELNGEILVISCDDVVHVFWE